MATKTHDLENWCMHNMIGLRHGTCVESGGALVVLQSNSVRATADDLVEI